MSISLKLSELDTPSLLIDKAKLFETLIIVRGALTSSASTGARTSRLTSVHR